MNIIPKSFLRVGAFSWGVILSALSAKAQDAQPTISFYSVNEEANVTMAAGGAQSAQAPLEITLEGKINCPDDYDAFWKEWKVWKVDEGEGNPLLRHNDENTSCTLTASGGYMAKFSVSFRNKSVPGDEFDWESEPFSIVIAESKLTCPDGFSPNGDGINDYFRVTAQSLVKFEAVFFNRWGQKLHSVRLENVEHAEGEPDKWVLWDGRVGGKYVKDGVYFVNINAVGSDGIEYKIKKAVNVLKGFRENSEKDETGR